MTVLLFLSNQHSVHKLCAILGTRAIAHFDWLPSTAVSVHIESGNKHSFSRKCFTWLVSEHDPRLSIKQFFNAVSPYMNSQPTRWCALLATTFPHVFPLQAAKFSESIFKEKWLFYVDIKITAYLSHKLLLFKSFKS